MVSESPTPWYHRQLWSNILGGVIVAFVIWFGPWILGVVTSAKLPAWIFPAAIAIAVLIASAIVPLWRRAIWGGLRRALRWVWSWRPVSARRLHTLRVHDVKMVLKAASDTDQAILDSLPDKVREVIRQDQESDARMKEMMQPLVEQLVQQRMKAARAETQSDSPALPLLPPPDPRFTFKYFGEKNGLASFEINNLMPDSVVYNARIEAEPSYGFRHVDPAFWKDLSGVRTVTFAGEIRGKARQDGLKLTLSWLDQEQAYNSEYWRIAGPDPKPDPWNTPYSDETPF